MFYETKLYKKIREKSIESGDMIPMILKLDDDSYGMLMIGGLFLKKDEAAWKVEILFSDF